jgi:hypothetical protein
VLAGGQNNTTGGFDEKILVPSGPGALPYRPSLFGAKSEDI